MEIISKSVKTNKFDSVIVKGFTVGNMLDFSRCFDSDTVDFPALVNILDNIITFQKNGNRVDIHDVEHINFLVALVYCNIISESDVYLPLRGYCDKCFDTAEKKDNELKKKLGVNELQDEHSAVAKYKDTLSEYRIPYTSLYVDADSMKEVITVEYGDFKIGFSPMTVRDAIFLSELTKNTNNTLEGTTYLMALLLNLRALDTESSVSKQVLDSLGKPFDEVLNLRYEEQFRYKHSIVKNLPRKFGVLFADITDDLIPSLKFGESSCLACNTPKQLTYNISPKDLLT